MILMHRKDIDDWSKLFDFGLKSVITRAEHQQVEHIKDITVKHCSANRHVFFLSD